MTGATLPATIVAGGPDIIAGGPGQGGLQIRLNLPDVLLLRSGSGERYQGELVVATTRFYREGQRPEFTLRSVPLDLTGKQRDAMLTEGVLFGDKEPPSGNMERLRIVVYDRGSGSIGALNVVVHDEFKEGLRE